ncbi:OVARIAN TUMOR DOMAIN-containing deubiquitinating enzyme 7 isoform X2 [Cannabis sativa]|uniref:OVARIAN TUMOR DOMAIN-containing deubiquitinating enzyme 7 isoform X2 n=1 Tax=Cannabis sativa TaxID=3483 RepID=UPI0011E05F25|nr:OVARIAN TUMOR DOMAIN-containing deubiquitinating enzyme 7 isoform X2 [Cannabis sativa]
MRWGWTFRSKLCVWSFLGVKFCEQRCGPLCFKHIVGQSRYYKVVDMSWFCCGNEERLLRINMEEEIWIKKQGKQVDISQFRAQLDVLGLKIIQVTADGNCFFRALADQLEGNEEEHAKYRSMVVQYILRNREMFEPFIEDEVPFDDYCLNMEKDGTWAGHMELQAASLVTRSNICIHRSMSPRWYIRNFEDQCFHMVHLSYHDGEHYNSVRSKEDSCEGPARPITIKVDADLTKKSDQTKAAENKWKGGAGRNIIDAGSIKLVIAGTGCANAEKVEEVLLQVDGDVDAAIEFLVAEQGTEECSVRPDSLSNAADNSPCNGCGDDRGEDKQAIEVEKTYRQDVASSSNNLAHENISSLPDDKISRNQLCPCGSKKKYKACCGTVSAKASNKFVISQTMDSRKGRRERKHGKKGASIKVVSACGPSGGPPDMGALCI